VTILKLLENALTIEGYTVYICDDSASAMDLIAVTRPDIIMLDIVMPEINGYELLEQIKSNRVF
jgi:DNA-binding response OmpR family regulator